MTLAPAAIPLTARLGIQLPIVQAPMAALSSPAMAAAVSNAGGLGSIAIDVGDVDRAARLIAEVRALTARPFNVGVFGRLPADRDAMVRMLESAHLPVVSFHHRLPSPPVIEALRADGGVLMATATSLHEARRVVDAGIDIVVARGSTSPLHRGALDPEAIAVPLGTLQLTRMLSRHLDHPVVAAGGFRDGVGIVAALKNGAGAAQLGTAFIATDESLATPSHRAALGSDALHARAVSSAELVAWLKLGMDLC